MYKATIGFLGSGNMTKSLISGLVTSGLPATKIWAHDHHHEKLDTLRQKFGIFISDDLETIIKKCNIILLSVKPQSMQELAQEIGTLIEKKRPLVISIAAGIPMSQLEYWFGKKTAIVRVMSNTPAMLQCGATGMYHNKNIATQQKNLTEHIMRAAGAAIWVDDENLMDIVTAVSGSGPAYFFLFMEAIQEVAIEMGLNQKQAKLLTSQTAYGAARMALESPESIEDLRSQVTSKGGVTAAAINSLESNGIRDMMKEALTANVKRSEELANLFSKTPKLGYK